MESAEKPVNDLHVKVGQSLRNLGHHGVPTLPPNEGPVFKEDLLKGPWEDLQYNAGSALEQAVNGGVTNVRTTQKKPWLIAKGRQLLKAKPWK